MPNAFNASAAPIRASIAVNPGSVASGGASQRGYVRPFERNVQVPSVLQFDPNGPSIQQGQIVRTPHLGGSCSEGGHGYGPEAFWRQAIRAADQT